MHLSPSYMVGMHMRSAKLNTDPSRTVLLSVGTVCHTTLSQPQPHNSAACKGLWWQHCIINMLVLDSGFMQSGAIPFNAPCTNKTNATCGTWTPSRLTVQDTESTQRLQHGPGKCLLEAQVQDALQATNQGTQGYELSSYCLPTSRRSRWVIYAIQACSLGHTVCEQSLSLT